MTCERCGEVLAVGQWPFCPHAAVRDVAVIGDEYPGGRVFENIDHHPITVYSKSELRRELDKHELRFTDRYHKNDGPDWRGMIDPQTLENARALVSRGGGLADDARVPLETLEMSVRTL